MRELTNLLRQLRLAIEAEDRVAPALETSTPAGEELVAAPSWAFDAPAAPAQVYMDSGRGDRLAA